MADPPPSSVAYDHVAPTSFWTLVLSTVIAAVAIGVAIFETSSMATCIGDSQINSVLVAIAVYFVTTLLYVLFICCSGASRPGRLRVRNTYPPVYNFVGIVFLATWLTAALDTVLRCTDAASITLFSLAVVETMSRVAALVAQQRYNNWRANAARTKRPKGTIWRTTLASGDSDNE